MSNLPWLTIIILLPILGGLFILLLPQRGNHLVRWYALGLCLVDFVLMTYVIYGHYQLNIGTLQIIDDFIWLDKLNFHWCVGLDGLSIGLFF